MENNIYYRIDGEEIEQELIDKFSLLDNLRNLRYSVKRKKTVLNFVGLMMSGDSLLVSFPKNYADCATSLGKYDIQLLVDVLLKNQQTEVDKYIGEHPDFISTYPLDAFFIVYRYYKKHGLIMKSRKDIKKGSNGKILWKEVIKNSEVIVDSGSIFFHPFFVKKNYSESFFLSECMSYVINYTFRRFSFICSNKTIGGNALNNKMFDNTKYIVKRLNKYKSFIFKDSDKNLLLAMISFFEEIEPKGDLIMKHFKFDGIWENMVTNYLNAYFENIELDEKSQTLRINYNEKNSNFKNKYFDKKIFSDIDDIKEGRRIEPDHFYESEEYRFIFDSKYYQSISSLDYKQIAYFYLLKNLNELKTVNVLILPTNGNVCTEIFFKLSKKYYIDIQDQAILYVHYLNIKEVMNKYINS